MVINLPYGRQPDLDGWKIPLLEVRQPDPANRDLAVRLASAFYKAMERGGSAGDGLWRSIRNSHHGPIVEVLEKRDFDALAEMLAAMFCSPVSVGLSSRDANDAAAAASPIMRLQTVDAIASLSMALGTMRVPNPAVPEPENVLQNDFQAILETIVETLGWDILPPQVGGIAGFPFRGAVIPHKQLFQIYAAQRIQSIFNGQIESLMEIGGGVGFLAYVCAVNKVVREYTIIDLPIVNMLQGYLLLNSRVADYVELFGESVSGPGGRRRIRILPDIAIDGLENKSIDMAFNQDSFPEMAHETMERYFDQISRIVRTYLLSINHESAQVSGKFSHGLVHATLRKRPEFEQVYRIPYWMRPGYVEELFRITDTIQN